MKWLMKILMALVLLVPAQAWAFENEPNGFRDLYWGETLEEVQQNRETKYMGYSKENNSVTYAVRLNDSESHVLSNEPIYRRAFLAQFWNNKLWGITVFFKKDDSFDSLKSAMTILFGNPEDNLTSCAWLGDETMILLDKVDSNWKMCAVKLGSINLMMEITNERIRQGW